MQQLRIGIVAAEPSGDLLAAGLMDALRELLPSVQFEGVAGPLMNESGIDEWASMDSLSVMGLFEVIQHLPRLLRLRAGLLQRWRDTPPAAFIGVDAPDFNLGVECRLRAAGIPTVHYVSPTVWAWRTRRVRKIRRAVDLLLTIFPFEAEFLDRYQVPSHYVGHPLACDMPLQPDSASARRELGLDPRGPVLAVLPGSRRGEVGRLARPFIETAVALRRQLTDLQVVVPLVNETTRAIFDQELHAIAPQLPVRVAINASRTALAAADVVLTASGTATLEGLLSKRPMVVGYKVQAATYWVARVLGLVKVRHVAMANLLADERLAPELIQGDCEARHLLPPLLAFFQDAGLRERIATRYREIHEQLRMDTNREAARAVVELLRGRGLV
ncbi:MAG TPA: lipid-A-disaccharide synthase [Gammaproteobacteria bacterium]|nr:lipid-A-disaccharide synthase [Gammaproteobacteria bacterium]HPQ24518.1 lipid-A-disaccharide synthase [Gammaproteobacteria bacterium]